MGIFSKFKKGFQKGVSVIQGAFDSISGKARLDEDSLLDLEEAFASDFGVDTTEELINSVRQAHRENKELRAEGVELIARTLLKEILNGAEGEDILTHVE